MSIVQFDGPPYWSLDASETGEEYKILVGRSGGGHGGRKNRVNAANMRRREAVTAPLPPPLPTGILYPPQFRSHQETKMAAPRTQRSTSTISRKNRGL